MVNTVTQNDVKPRQTEENMDALKIILILYYEKNYKSGLHLVIGDSDPNCNI